MDGNPPAKRAKLQDDISETTSIRAKREAFLKSLSRPVSPPPVQSDAARLPNKHEKALTDSWGPHSQFSSFAVDDGRANKPTDEQLFPGTTHQRKSSDSTPKRIPRILPSPIQLSKIRDLPFSDNVDNVSLHDILGDPLIKEVWIFNFCFDVDWFMQYFDPDVRDMIQIKIVHGSWRREDMNKIRIDDACSRLPNVQAIQAWLPDAFGTHHSKMFVLFRHDDCGQVIIHTANMLAKDWTNMTQAIWRSPLLSQLKYDTPSAADDNVMGIRFKHDFVRYLKTYGNKLKPLIQQLQSYDFTDIKAALVASAPTKFKLSAPDNEVWGHEMLRRNIQKVTSGSTTSTHHVVFQVSSIASLPSNWLEETLYPACGSSKQSTSIIFPTAPDVAKSLDGYAAGGSIHTKAQKPVHLKQISLLRPQLCRWTMGPIASSRAGRDLAAPHIKTYVRFASRPTDRTPAPDIEWALVTSANLSTQAWGSAPKLAKGEKNPKEALIHIQSYEIGVLVWPNLYMNDAKDGFLADGKRSIRMIPTFGKDKPDCQGLKEDTAIGFRMPYDLPLTSYGADELPWSPQSSYAIPDRHGVLWQ